MSKDTPAFTLEMLAWFNRCLFPDDFRDDLMKRGVPHFEATMYSRHSYIEKGIVGVYQIFINDEKMRKAIEDIVLEYANKYHQITKDKRPCMFKIGKTTCGYPEDGPLHEGSGGMVPPAGRHKYQPECQTVCKECKGSHAHKPGCSQYMYSADNDMRIKK